MLPKSRRNKHNKTAKLLIGLIILLLIAVVGVKSNELRQQRDLYTQKQTQLEEQIAREMERSEEIAEYEKYTHTKAYVEDIARNRLGLVYEGELLFRDEN